MWEAIFDGKPLCVCCFEKSSGRAVTPLRLIEAKDLQSLHLPSTHTFSGEVELYAYAGADKEMLLLTTRMTVNRSDTINFTFNLGAA